MFDLSKFFNHNLIEIYHAWLISLSRAQSCTNICNKNCSLVGTNCIEIIYMGFYLANYNIWYHRGLSGLLYQRQIIIYLRKLNSFPNLLIIFIFILWKVINIWHSLINTKITVPILMPNDSCFFAKEFEILKILFWILIKLIFLKREASTGVHSFYSCKFHHENWPSTVLQPTVPRYMSPTLTSKPTEMVEKRRINFSTTFPPGIGRLCCQTSKFKDKSTEPASKLTPPRTLSNSSARNPTPAELPSHETRKKL